MNAEINSPLRGRPLAIALTSLFVLFASLSVPRPTGFEWYAFGAGLVCSVVFWFQCDEWLKSEENAAIDKMMADHFSKEQTK